MASIRSDGGDTTGFAAHATDLDALERLREETERACGAADVLGAFVAGALFLAYHVRLLPARPHAGVAHTHGLIVLTSPATSSAPSPASGDNSLLPHFGLPRALPD
jgi:hypothetical protein